MICDHVLFLTDLFHLTQRKKQKQEYHRMLSPLTWLSSIGVGLFSLVDDPLTLKEHLEER
jgi:hypothetical protein